MEFPFNQGPHHANVTHTHYHHRRDDDEEESPYYPPPANPSFNNHHPYQPPPQQPHPPFHGIDRQPPPQPPFYGINQPPSPPQPRQPETQVFHTSHTPPPPQPRQPETQVFHTSHTPQGHVSHQNFNYSDPPVPPPPHHHQADHSFNYGGGYPSAPPSAAYTPQAPPNPSVHHVSHETHNPHNAQFSSPVTVHHVGHQSGSVGALSNKRAVRVVTKANPNYSLTVRYGKVILATSDPTDVYQHWYKDEKYSTRVKDKEGCPAFSLVNKVTGEAIKHSIGATHPVHLIPYNPDFLDESILWTESRDLGDGYRAIRMVNNIHLNVDAYHGDKNSGGVHDGTTIVLWEWNKGDNQRWKILPY